MKPLKDKITVTSKFGMRIHPITNKKTMHYGQDNVSNTSKDLFAMADGQVIEVVNKGSKGGTMCLIRIQHKKYQSAYYHNESGSAKVKKGDWVKAGDLICRYGNTGNVTGAHAHIQVDKGSNATAIDPSKYISGEKELEGLTKREYTTGNYEVISPRYVRVGAGTEYRIKKVAELTKDGQAHCVNKKKTANAQYSKGTHYTALEINIAKNGSIWAKTPSGYVCIESSKGAVYCKKI